MEEEYSPPASDTDPNLEVGISVDDVAEESDFCLLSEDGTEMEDSEERVSLQATENVQRTSEGISQDKTTGFVDIETMKRKAEEIACSLRKIRSKRTVESSELSHDYEPAEELKHYRERSAFVAQKLKEDRLLFEESKKRNEAVVDKVRTVKQIQKNISESVKELKRDDPSADETIDLRLKIDRLEASLSHLKNTLASKNQIIQENKETIRTLNESVDDTRATYLSYVEQSQDEIQQLRNEHLNALEKITKSRDEFYNQLQTVRKKCLLMENDLRLSEFARFRLVSRNAELRERVCQLETELQIPHVKSISMEDDEEGSETSLSNQTIAVSELTPKIQCLAAITDEFYSYLVDTGNCDLEDLVQLDEDGDSLQSMDKISDRMESLFYVVRDKLSSLSDLEDHTKQTEKKLHQLEAIIEENKTQDAKLKKILATMKAKIQSETNINKDLTEQLLKAQESIKHLEQNSEQDWAIKCQELERSNHQLQYELNALQNTLSTYQSSSHLQSTVEHLKRELEAKMHECEKLQAVCEELGDTNDKLENDFVVLRTRDCEETEHWEVTCASLKEENEKLLGNMRLMSVRATEYENERLSLYQQIDELKRTVKHLTNQLETLNEQSLIFRDDNMKRDGEMQATIENLTTERCDLLGQLNHVNKQVETVSCELNHAKEKLANESVLREQMQLELSHEIHDLQKRNQELESVKLALEKNIDELKNRIETQEALMQRYAEQANEKLLDYQKMSEERDSRLEYVQNHNASLQAEIEELLADKNTMVATLAEYEKKISNDGVNMETLRRANEELTSSVRQLRQTVSEIEDEKEQLANQYEMQLAKDGCLTQELESLKSKVMLLEKEKQHLLDEYEQYRSRVEILENERTKIQDVQEVQMHVASLKADKQMLESECEKFKTKYQRLQLLCKANINKAVQEAKAEAEKYRIAWMEATKQQSSSEGLSDPVSHHEADLENWKTAYIKVQDELVKAHEHEAALKKTLTEEFNEKIESWKHEYEEADAALHAAQDEINGLKQLVAEYEVELQKAHEVSAEQVERTMQTDESQLLDVESAVDVVVSECMRRTDDDVQKAVDEVVNECLLQTDNLRNCINDLKNENHRLREQYKGMEHCQMRVDQLQEELRLVRLDYNELERRLYDMEEESGIEIARYEELLTKARNDLKSVERCLTETRNLLQQKEKDYFEYRCQMEAFTSSERKAQVPDSHQQKNATVDATVQTDRNVESTSTGSEKQPVTIASYFDYYKGKITKEFTNVLQPEEQGSDYSNWILPEKQDAEYQEIYQQVPSFGYEGHEENADTSADKSSQTGVVIHDQACQVETSNFDKNRLDSVSTTQIKRSLSEVVEQLRELLINKTNGDEWAMNEDEWMSDELEVYHENFVNTTFKFVDLFEAIIRYYSSLPQSEIMFNKFKELLGIHQSKCDDDSMQWNHLDSYNQLITLCAHLECENKYLVEAVTFVEDTVLTRSTTEIIRIQDVLQHWREDKNFEESDIIDKVCEEYDIVPSKFAAGALFATWKETILKSVELPTSVVTETTIAEPGSYSIIEPPLVTLMKKNHKLIGDLFYKYGADKNFDPNEFFDQIDDINQDVERLVKFVKGEITEIEHQEIADVSAHVHSHHDHDHDHNHDHDGHDHHDHDHHHHADHDHHHHHHQHDHKESHPGDDGHDHKIDNSTEVTELKELLAQSNEKIDSLVREVMEAKNSKDYNEMRQLHSKLDETLYHLHLSDIHNAELTQELTQLLSERDALQLKLSSIIRQYEELRQTFLSPNIPTTKDVQLSNVSEKIEELNKVNYMKDPRISEVSKNLHTAGIQVFTDDSAETIHRVREESASGFGVPSLFKWITGDSDSK